jgi:hypothetical protein
MPSSKHGVVIKVPPGVNPPPGFVFVRELRGKRIYKKEAAPSVADVLVDQLESMFGNMGLEAVAVPDIDALVMGMGGLVLGGRSRRRTHKSKTRKIKRKSRSLKRRYNKRS